MKLMVFCLFVFVLGAFSQEKKVRASLGASVSQRIGADTDIEINYSRPGVKGRTIWGELVPYGMSKGNKWSKGNDFPWRAGANENTTINLTSNVFVEGKELKAGKYGLHMVPGKENWVVIFTKRNEDWGSYSYDPKEDALRVEVKAVKSSHSEWLTYGFKDLAKNSAVAYLHWEKLTIPFKISLAE